MHDAIVVGAGPNGLAAAITMARAGCSVQVLEAKGTIGGGCRSAQLTLPGFTHDVCSAIHPLGVASPFLRSLPLERYGVEWVHPDVMVAHPLENGGAAWLTRSLEETTAELGADYGRLMRPLVEHWQEILKTFLGPLRPAMVRHPIIMARFGLLASRSVVGLARGYFKEEKTRALFAGLGAHSILPLERPPSAAFGLVMGLLAHSAGWPIALGGSQAIVNAMAAYLRDLGGEIVTGAEVKSLDALPPAQVVLCDVTPRQLMHMAGERVRGLYEWQLRSYRYGPGIFKMDLALDGPVPWLAEACRHAGTVHVGGTLEEIAAAEQTVARGGHPERPFVLVAQQSLFDPGRAPQGQHTLWAYCHVPNGSQVDMTERVEAQIERFAPGFRKHILARHVYNAHEMERYNSNYVGGDINGGVQDFFQLFTRPAIQPIPYATSDERLYLCSSSTPPGGGVHGMCGHFAARAALQRLKVMSRRQNSVPGK